MRRASKGGHIYRAQSRPATTNVGIRASITVWLLVVGLTNAYSDRAQAEQANVAVATNFRDAARALVDAYTEDTDHQVKLITGSNGKLYTQIVQGAPFDLFLAADQTRPALLAEQGWGVTASLQTYAIGRLALLAHKPTSLEVLTTGDFRTLAIANPKLAPYGVAAEQVLKSLKVRHRKSAKWVIGENVGQAYAMVATGNADVGLVAHAILRPSDFPNMVIVPETYHDQINQDLVLLQRGTNNSAATGFVEFLNSQIGLTIINNFGYQTQSDD